MPPFPSSNDMNTAGTLDITKHFTYLALIHPSAFKGLQFSMNTWCKESLQPQTIMSSSPYPMVAINGYHTVGPAVPMLHKHN